ncbi:MAG TPA: hypothetical protein VGP87_15120 [Gemmatimonadales bacterium]|jgi:hypothetical protein|nr:hypothetical protein [Gemmatimonadales bacterium]
MQGHTIVAHFIDGSVKKGQSLDVDPKRPICHLKTESGGTIEVALEEVKALFFVRSATGDPARQEAREAVPGDSRLVGARRVRVMFADREEIIGLMNRYPPTARHFFMLPIDPLSNNLRILVNRAAVKEMGEVHT